MKTILHAAAIALLLAAPAPGADQESEAVFPFVKAHYWLYDGTVTFAKDGEVREKKITGWKSEVVDTAEGTGFKAALLKGHPSDLAWYEDNKKRSDAIVVLTSNGEFHEICDVEDKVQKFGAIKSTGVLPRDLIGHETIRFKFPPKKGDRFGDPEQTKLGSRYCWFVLDAGTAKLDPEVKGAPSKERLTVNLTYRTSPDHTNVRFVAGVGIVFYEYVHHGTRGDCEMRLVETGETTKKPDGTTK